VSGRADERTGLDRHDHGRQTVVNGEPLAKRMRGEQSRVAVMGYTTSFRGEFRCRRPVAAEVESFLAAIEADAGVIPVLADWLEDHQDERAAQVRGCRTHPEAFNLFHALAPEHAAYLERFSGTRRLKRDPEVAKTIPDPIREAVGLPIGVEAGYFVGATGHAGQDEDASILDYNRPPAGQPGLWCQWVPSEDGSSIVWDGGQPGLWCHTEWIEYLIQHFLRPWGYILEGEMSWQGEEEEDRGLLVVRNNVVKAIAED
jgi:hypothetical protein